MSATTDITALRHELERIDADLIRLAAERIRVGRAIGAAKRRVGRPTVDYARERDVLERGRDIAVASGLDVDVVDDLLARLIRASVTAQEADHIRDAGIGSGRRAVVVGGAGRMGAWFVRFLSDLGYETAVLDPAAPHGARTDASAWLREADIVLCAAPPSPTAALYDAWCAAPPRGVVVDIASIKTPLLPAMARLQAAGARVASLHPMFGPATVLLRDADVVSCDIGDADAQAVAEGMFAPTTARIVRMPIAAHDAVMADLLALAHATAIVFAAALPAAGHPVRSTTFQALERIAGAVVRESPAVYYEIQAANPHAAAARHRLRDRLDELVRAVEALDPTAFASLMDDGRLRTPA